MARALPLRVDWEAVKDGIMFEALLTKFRTHPPLATVLLATNGRTIVENAPGDGYWDCGPDSQGLNKLGQILTRVRTIQRQP